MATNKVGYKTGSLAALRAERQRIKDQENNIIMKPKKVVVTNNNNTQTQPNTNKKSKKLDNTDLNANIVDVDDNNNNNNANANANDNNNVDDDDDDNRLNTPIQNGYHLNSNSGYVDEYGFFLSFEEKKEKLQQIGSDVHRNRIRKQNERIYKWLHMLDNWDIYTTTKKAKLKSRIRKGIPAPLRAKVWTTLLGVNDLSKDEKLYYSKLRYKTPVAKFKTSIDNDLDRTFPRHILFGKDAAMGVSGKPLSSPSTRGKDSLRNVLYAFANHDTDVGYTQGMGFIAALFLMLMTEDSAFWCLVRILDHNGDFQMRGLYLDGLPLLHMRYFQFNQLLFKFQPKLYEHLKSFGIIPELYASKWFITIFVYEFSFDFVYRIWDVYLNEGTKFVFRVSLALLMLNEKSILKIKSFDNCMKYIQSLHKYIPNNDINVLLNKAFDLGLKHEHLQIIEEQYNKKKLHQARMQRKGGSGRRSSRRGTGDIEPPDIEQIKRLSSPLASAAAANISGNNNDKSFTDPNDNTNTDNLNDAYQKKVQIENQRLQKEKLAQEQLIKENEEKLKREKQARLKKNTIVEEEEEPYISDDDDDDNKIVNNDIDDDDKKKAVPSLNTNQSVSASASASSVSVSVSVSNNDDNKTNVDNDDKKINRDNEGSHSASSYVDHESSSDVPKNTNNNNQQHNILPPNKDDTPPPQTKKQIPNNDDDDNKNKPVIQKVIKDDKDKSGK